MAEDVNFLNLSKINRKLQSLVMLPNKVMSAEEEKRMTDNDRTGRVWDVGDEILFAANQSRIT